MTQSHVWWYCGRSRQAIHEIFTAWNRASSSLMPWIRVLDGVLAYLGPLPTPQGGHDSQWRSLLNAQISVDSARPSQLRLTLDPFRGKPFSQVTREQTAEAFDALACKTLTERVVELYAVGGELPQGLWIGVAPNGGGCVVKAYMLDRRPNDIVNLPNLARRAGWLPPVVQPSFGRYYDRLVPVIAELEGIGISFSDNQWLGTTFYLRAIQPWHACTSAAMAAILEISPDRSLERLFRAFGPPPTAFGWSIESDHLGHFVDLKLEVAIVEPEFSQTMASCASEFGIDIGPIEALGRVIAASGLSDRPYPSPAILSLRFVEGKLRGIVAYFRLIVPHESNPLPA
jgi:hypothetical protein